MQIQQMLDASLFALSFWLAWHWRTSPEFVSRFGLPDFRPSQSFLWPYLVLVIGGPLVLEGQGFYNRSLLASRTAVVWPLLKSCFLVTIGLVLILFALHLALARLIALLFGVTSFSLIYAKDEILRFALRTKFGQAQFQRKFILVGTEEETARMRRRLQSPGDDELVVTAELNLNKASIEDLIRLLHEHSVNGVILNARHNYFEQIENAIRTCELEGVEVWLVADFFRTQISRTSFGELYGRPVLVFRTAPDASWQSFCKQVLDILLALISLALLAPVFILIAALIKSGSSGPILFRQKRCGLNGQPFTILKFRTMATDAEQRQHELASMNEMSGPVFKIANDPRITPIGRVLRRWSLDELPQLYNVLRGEMSMVGPRPLPVDEVRRFQDLAHRRRLSVKPGLTCLWQISGRNNVSDFRDWVRLDLEYIDNWSLWLDLKILWRTIPAVLTGTGAK
jgi:exopolysaccharide biosynthesis polyprenyl glycosylphosphotransferase